MRIFRIIKYVQHEKRGTTVKTVGSNKNPDVMLKLALHFQNARQVSRFSALAQNF